MKNINDYRKEKEEKKQMKIDEANMDVKVATRRLNMKQECGVAKEKDVEDWFRAVGLAHKKRDDAKK